MITPKQINNYIKKNISKEMADVLIPLLSWKITNKEITLVNLPFVWLEVFKKYIQNDVLLFCEKNKRKLVVSNLDEVLTSGKQSFETLFVDPSNQFAVSACKQACLAPGQTHNPLYIFGETGTGKTHIISAIENDAKKTYEEDAVVRFSGTNFINKYASELAQNPNGELKEKINEAIFICFDNVDFLENKKLAQEQFFLILNQALENGQQVVITGQTAIGKLKNLEKRLSSRLSWGLSVHLENPMLETKIAVLKEITNNSLNEIDQERLPELVQTFAPNMHQITELGKDIRAGINVFDNSKDISFDTILNIVAPHFEIKASDIPSKSRAHKITKARQTTVLIARKLTKYKLKTIGSLLGGRDHTTIMYNYEEAKKREDENENYANLVKQIIGEIL